MLNDVEDHESNDVASVPPKETRLLDWVELKLFPSISMLAPTAPKAGCTSVIVGAGTTEKLLELVAEWLPTVTLIVPLVAPKGTEVVICVLVAETTDAIVPWNATVLSAGTGLKFVPAIVTALPTPPLDGANDVIVGDETAKLEPLVPVCPLTVTAILPVVAEDGTVAISCVLVAEITFAAVLLNVTLSFVETGSKFAPEIVTWTPKTPLVGLNEEMMGGVVTVKLLELTAVEPETVTLIGPVEAPEGTVTTSFVVVADETVAAAPLNCTESFDLVALKFVPLMVTDVPTAPLVGEKLERVGGNTTVKLPLLVAVLLPTLTEIFPVLAPFGTAVTICVVVDDETVAMVPLNLTVLLVAVALKFLPEIVTAVPIAPLCGLKLEIVGDAASAIDAPNNATIKIPGSTILKYAITSRPIA